MEIFKDAYKLNAVEVDEAEPDSGDDFPHEDFGGVIGFQYRYCSPERRVRTVPVPESAADSQCPRYCARFYVGAVEGFLRIYPSPSSLEWTAVKDDPIFQFRWRGRETGDGQIQTEALGYAHGA